MSNGPDELRSRIEDLYKDASTFLQKMDASVPRRSSFYTGATIYTFWPAEDQRHAAELAQRIRREMASVADVIAGAPLMEEIDRQRLRINTKVMEAAVTGRTYSFWDKEYEEGYGFRPQGEQMTACFTAEEARGKLTSAYRSVLNLLDLVGMNSTSSRPVDRLASRATASYSPNTAFLMMWIDKSLDDVTDSVKDVFKDFGVAAQRADDIEHDGAITPRILNEIERAEFLFADLTGARPNVYYEIGFAHALGKRVILFRKSGTGIHFDLAGHNCPEYDSLRDLKAKLRKRLEAITGRNGVQGSRT